MKQSWTTRWNVQSKHAQISIWASSLALGIIDRRLEMSVFFLLCKALNGRGSGWRKNQCPHGCQLLYVRECSHRRGSQVVRKEPGLEPSCLVSIVALLLTCCVTFCQPLNFSVPQFLHLQNGDNDSTGCTLRIRRSPKSRMPPNRKLHEHQHGTTVDKSTPMSVV